MYDHTSDEVSMCFEALQFLHGVVVKHRDVMIISCSDDPIIPDIEGNSSDWFSRYLEGLHISLFLVVMNSDIARVECRGDPRKTGMQLHTLHSFAPDYQLLLDF